MAAIRIQLPGREAASLIALNGGRITIGRSPANTIQILDRSMSLRHAELINEGGYYRLHDVGSTNGVFVNGEQVTDYHLREKCKMAFGTLECEFLPDLPAESNIPVETLPSREEMAALQEENSSLRARLSNLGESVGALQKDAALKERETALEARPAVAEIESLRTENAKLTVKLDAHAVDLERLRAVAAAEASSAENLRAEYSALEVAHGSLKVEVEELRSELSSARSENLELARRAKEQARELEEFRRSHASLLEQVAERVSLEEHQKLLGEHRGGKDRQRCMEEEIADLKKELTLLAAERERLQRHSDKQRMELETMPKPAKIELLRTVNAELGARVKELTLTLASLRKVQADYASQAEGSVPQEAHEKLVAEHEALQRAHQQNEAELAQARQQLAEFKALCENLEQRLQTQDGEIEALRKRVEAAPPFSPQAIVPGQTHLPATKDEASPHTASELNGEQIEEALGKLGFVLRPIRRDLTTPPRNGANGSSGEHIGNQPSSSSITEDKGAK